MLRKEVPIVAIAVALVGLNSSSCLAQRDVKIRVAVTLDILKTIISPILGDKGEIYSIASGEVEPHSFTLTSSIIREVLNSDLIVITGHMDWEKKLVERVSEERSIQPSLTSINLLELNGIRILDIEGEKNIHGFWLLPDNAIVIAEALKDKLSTIKPEYSEEFTQNYILFEKRILKLKDALAKLSEKYGQLNKKVVVGFYSEQYIAEAMGLQVSIVLKGEEETIKPETLMKVYDGFKSGEYACILVSDVALSMSSVQNALRELSEETGCSIAYVLTISSNGLDQYDSVMYYNAGQVYNALLTNRRSSSSGFNIYFLTAILALFVVVIETIILIRSVRRRTAQ